MGYDIDIVFEQDGIAPELLCPICTGILDNPVRTPCSHLFCQSCIGDWLSRSSKICPQCRTNLASFDGKAVDRLIKNIVGVTKVKCTKFQDGCTWVGKLDDLQAHPCSVKACSCAKCPYKDGLAEKTKEVEQLTAQCSLSQSEVAGLRLRISQLESAQAPSRSLPLIAQSSPAIPAHLRISTDPTAVARVRASLVSSVLCDHCRKSNVRSYYRCVECVGVHSSTGVNYDLCVPCFAINPPVHAYHHFVKC